MVPNLMMIKVNEEADLWFLAQQNQKSRENEEKMEMNARKKV